VIDFIGTDGIQKLKKKNRRKMDGVRKRNPKDKKRRICDGEKIITSGKTIIDEWMSDGNEIIPKKDEKSTKRRENVSGGSKNEKNSDEKNGKRKNKKREKENEEFDFRECWLSKGTREKYENVIRGMKIPIGGFGKVERGKNDGNKECDEIK
jgi:hypothetical protein